MSRIVRTLIPSFPFDLLQHFNPMLNRSIHRSALATRRLLKVVCELDPCPGGLESVLVGDEAAAQLAGRMLLLRDYPQSESISSQRGRNTHQTARQGERPPKRAARDGDGGASLRGRGRARRSGDEEAGAGGMLWQGQGAGRPRRRLADIEEVEFSVPSEGGSEGGDGEAATESQQAAALFNNVADSVSEAWGMRRARRRLGV